MTEIAGLIENNFVARKRYLVRWRAQKLGYDKEMEGLDEAKELFCSFL